MKIATFLASVAASLLVGLGTAQEDDWTCLVPPMPRFQPQMAPGYKATLLMTGLNHPRSIIFDPLGKLLVLEKGSGVRKIEVVESWGNVCIVKTKQILSKPELNHGLTMSADGKMLFASSYDKVMSFGYDAMGGGNILSDEDVIVNMANADRSGHETRTVLASKFQPGWLLVSKGSDGNIDLLAQNISTGHSTIKYFPIDVTSRDTADHAADGFILAAGVRNSVGVAEHPITGTIWSVENSMDDVTRFGIDVHNDNPAEELNFHGVFQPMQNNGFNGLNYGYPNCVAAWDPSTLGNPYLQRGAQFAPNIAYGVDPVAADTACGPYTTPWFAFPAHMAPMDIKFQPDGMAAWVAFHGSWDRSPPQGYSVARITFGPDGMPAITPDRVTVIMQNPDNTQCPYGCFRPTGLAFDAKGRLFMVSDDTGELYVIEGGV